MNKIGLIGGLSWESTIEYYRIINEEVRKRTSPRTSAKLILNSLNFQEVADLQHAGKWEELYEMMAEAALELEQMGANAIFICTNLMHKAVPTMESRVSVPIIHIADVVAKQVKKDGFKKIGLLGTVYTMEHDFYKKRLEEKHGIKVIIPEKADRDLISEIIYKELCCGVFSEKSKAEYLRVITNLVKQGAQGIALACTEIPLLVKDGEAEVPLYETTYLHAMAAVDEALK
ncbi:MAG: aspartate/glutamate racemase family protein [bacterium]